MGRWYIEIDRWVQRGPSIIALRTTVPGVIARTYFVRWAIHRYTQKPIYLPILHTMLMFGPI